MKIVLMGKYNRSEILNGPEKFAKRIYQESIQTDDNYYFIDYFRGREFSLIKKLFGSEACKYDNLTVHRLGIIKSFLFLLTFKPDLLHIATFEFFQISALLYKLISKVKIIYTVHGFVNYENSHFRNNHNTYYDLKDRITEKLFINYSDKLIFVSENLLSLMKQYYSIVDSKVKIIPNGVDEIYFDSSKENSYDGKLKIVFCGDVDRKEKGFEFFSSFVETLSEEIQIFCITDNGEQLRHSYNYINFVDRLPTPQYAEFISGMSIFISASIYEPFQIVMIEMMAAGVVPLVSMQTGASYLIEQGKNGFVFDTAESLRKYITKLEQDRKLLQKLSIEARNSVKQITWSKIFQAYYQIYRDLVNG